MFSMTSKRAWVAFSVATALLMSACTQAAFVLANARTNFTSEHIARDVQFDAAHDLKLNVYKPEGTIPSSSLPVVVFFYGGRWTTGDKDNYDFVADYFTRLGYVVVIPDYRKYPKVKFPAFVEDGARAVKWTHDNIGRFGGNGSKLILAGHSAGAHMAAMLSFDQRYLENISLSSSVIRAVIGLSGPYDFTPEDADLKDMFGPPENYPQMQVTNFVDQADPPALLIYGEQDVVVEKYNLERLQKAIEARKGRVSVKTYSTLDHVGTVAALSWVGKTESGLPQDIATFLNKGEWNL